MMTPGRRRAAAPLTPRIELDTCVLRTWRRGDEAELARQANDERVARNMRDYFPQPYTLTDARTWVALNLQITPATSLAIEVRGRVAGAIGLRQGEDVFRRSAEIGYWLGVAHHGRGIATEAVRAFVEYAFATFDVCRLQAGVFEWNAASARVLEKAGFVLESRERSSITKDGRTADRFVYALVRDGTNAGSAP